MAHWRDRIGVSLILTEVLIGASAGYLAYTSGIASANGSAYLGLVD